MSDHTLKIILSILILAAVSVWMGILIYPDQDLKIITCDVGQGDGILVTNGTSQLLIDGGPDNSVIDCLDRYIPFWDRKIEMIILTHPDKDHFFGLIEVFRKYDVQRFLVSELNPDTPEYGVLEEMVGGRNTLVIRPKKGMSIRWGLMYLDIVHPSKTFMNRSLDDKIDYSANNSSSANVLGSYTSSRVAIVFSLRYKNFDALFTGDIGPEVMDVVLQSDINDVEYLQVPHHGSKNGLTVELLHRSTPEIAVISAGKNNPHGHPHREVIELLSDEAIKILRTDEIGDVVVRTDGEKVYFGK